MRAGELADLLRARVVEVDVDDPALGLIDSGGVGDVLAAHVGSYADDEFFGLLLGRGLLFLVRVRGWGDGFVFLVLTGDDHVSWRHDVLAGLDARNDVGALRIDELELQLGDALEGVARVVDLLRVQARELHEDGIIAHRRDDGFADTVNIDARADDLDGGVARLRADARFGVVLDQPDEELRAAAQVEPEVNLLARRVDREQRADDEHGDERQPEPTFAQAGVGREVPAEKSEDGEAEDENVFGTHGERRGRVKKMVGG